MRMAASPDLAPVQDQKTRARDGFLCVPICFSFIRANELISAREIPRLFVRARFAHPAANRDANLAGNVPSLIKNREEREREHRGIVVVGARANPLRSARWQTRAECVQRAYFHQFHVSRSTARSYFIDDLSARKRVRKRERD